MGDFLVLRQTCKSSTRGFSFNFWPISFPWLAYLCNKHGKKGCFKFSASKSIFVILGTMPKNVKQKLHA